MIKITGKLATLADKILGDYQDKLGIFCWRPEDEKVLLDAEQKYFEITGINPYETPCCPSGFEQDALNFKNRMEHRK